MTINDWITEARGRCEAATAEPWEVHPNPRYYVLLPTDDWGDPNRDGNAAFCAAARTDLPKALEAVDVMAGYLASQAPDKRARRILERVREILTGAAGARVEKESDDEQ